MTRENEQKSASALVFTTELSPPPPPPRHHWLSSPHTRSPHFPHRAQYSFHWLPHQWAKVYPDFRCHRGYSAPQWTYRWEIAHLFSDVFSHLFQPEPFSALPHNTWMRCPVPVLSVYTFTGLVHNALFLNYFWKKGRVSLLFQPWYFPILMKQSCVTIFFSVLKAEQSCAGLFLFGSQFPRVLLFYLTFN